MRGRYILIAVLFWAAAARAEHRGALQNNNGGQFGGGQFGGGQSNGAQGNGQNYQGNGMALGGGGGGISGGSGGGGGGSGASYQQRSDPNATAKFGEQSQKAIAELNKSNVSFAKDSSANLKELLKSAEVPEASGDFVKNGYDAIAAKTAPDLSKDGDSIVNSIQTNNTLEAQNILMMRNALIGPAAAKPAVAAVAAPTVGATIAAFNSGRSVGSISGSGLGSGTVSDLPSSRVHALAAITEPSGVARGVTGNASVQGAPSRGIMGSTGPVYNAPTMRMPASVH